jgi:exopolyphosphatase / guanosine-5'-triphosphate,3'-diphosphate pyrophosphatase
MPDPEQNDGRPSADDMSRMLAAVDLGSNSFRMVIARLVGDDLRIVDRLREGVRLAGYLDSKQHLTDEGKLRALSCLRKFGQRVRDFPQGTVRAVGTNTLRKARNTQKLLRQAERILGHPIEIVSGQEEARLIFLGACHSLPVAEDRRLVVDIGGGSTECVIGEAFEPIRAESLYMGCVSFTLKYFPDGRISGKRLRRAETAARLEMRPVKAELRRMGWSQAVGASGTIQAVAEILHLNGWSERGIDLEGLRKLRKAILAFEHVDDLELPGLGRERARVLVGGVAILAAVFDSLRIESMSVSSGAMREGVLWDLLGRIRHEDARDRTIQRFIEQYQVDLRQVVRVERTALYFLDQVLEAWDLDAELARHFLSWGASLHAIGLGIAHAGYHKHGAYLIEHSDMPGFSFQDQRVLSLLVRVVRRKFVKSVFRQLPKARARMAMRLALLLRLAVLLNRSRSDRDLPEMKLEANAKSLRLEIPDAWLEEHPLTRADLEQERTYLEAAGFRLRVRPSPARDVMG